MTKSLETKKHNTKRVYLMKVHIENRIKVLKREYLLGKEALYDLDAKQLNLRETLLRISGAIQVLEELLAECDNAETNSVDVDHNIHPPVPPDPSELDSYLPDVP